MGKIIEVIPLNGGSNKIELEYTEEQELEVKENMKFTIDGITYAGWCRKCNNPVEEIGAMYIENVDGLGNLHVDVFHKYCL